MRNKIHIIFLLFLLLICTKSGTSFDYNSIDLESKSRKNWFTKDFKISPSKITTEDLLSGPGRNWLLYHGDYKASHYSPLSEINRGTVGNLVTKWVYPIASGASLRSSPIVYEGVMYVTAANEVHALDAKTGQWIWAWRAYEKRSSGGNRGVAIYENKILFSTLDCKSLNSAGKPALEFFQGLNTAWNRMNFKIILAEFKRIHVQKKTVIVHY